MGRVEHHSDDQSGKNRGDVVCWIRLKKDEEDNRYCEVKPRTGRLAMWLQIEGNKTDIGLGETGHGKIIGITEISRFLFNLFGIFN